MSERKALYYGQMELIPGIVCDGYILDDNTSVLSERGTADLLGMDQKTLEIVRGNWPPIFLKLFTDKDYIMRGNYIKVLAPSPHYGRNIVVYTTMDIETIIRAYATAFVKKGLRKNQLHIGERAVALSIALIRTALDTAIKQACGFSPNIQETAQKHYRDAVRVLKEMGLQCSVPGDIATKKDIATFLKVPESTLSSFLRKYHTEIKPVRLDHATILALGSRAHRMYVAKIAAGMDTEISMEIKKQMFGDLGFCANTQTKSEIQWRQALARAFEGFGLQYNYPIGRYRVDFFVEKLMLVLECNGYAHRYYDPEEEAKREKAITRRYALVRFHHQASWPALVNAILQARPGTTMKVYDSADVCNQPQN